jgi:hypothetical protein
MNSNPLAKFFRQPAIYVRLPSQGRGWEPGSIDYPANGEIPVMPMTALDEITYRTPDALFNGESTVSVIQSCVPCIKNAWAMPSMDIDPLLISIRIATYGHSLDIESTCPKCNEEHNFGLDLRTVLDKLGSSDYSKPLESGDLTFIFRPLNYKEMNDNSQLQFEQQKILQMASDDDDTDDQTKIKRINDMMKKLMEVTVKALSHSIDRIQTTDTLVTDRAHIEEFLNNCDRSIFERVKNHVIELKESAEVKPLSIKCPSCSHQYEQAFTLDMTRFFGRAS